MKPVSFDYYAPTSVAEALDLLAQIGYEGKVLAGGQSLVPSMNFRLAQPTALVDLNTIPELFYIKPSDDNGLLVGAMTRCSTVEFDKLIEERAPVIHEAMPIIAHTQIRNRGTFGGAIAHADPTGHLPAITLALNARYHIKSKKSDRWVNADDFFIGPFTTTLEPDDLLIETAIPPLPPYAAASYKQAARQTGAQAMVGVTAMVFLDDKGRCQSARLSYLSVGEKPLLAPQAAQKLIGEKASPELFETVGDIAATKDLDPGADIHCTVEYRKHLIRVLTRQALTEAFERASKK
jgi:CO/xanthine dehydrogenase FAD-binding subunit